MSYNNPRIQLTDTGMDVITKMAGANVGALTVLMKIMEASPIVDPDGFMGGIGSLMGMDNLDIYEDRIWMLFKDVCKQDVVDVLVVLRANQLGYLSETNIKNAVDGNGSLDLEDLRKQVKERLPSFNLEYKKLH